MTVNVLLEPLEGEGYRATCGAPWAESVEAPSREAALALIEGRLRVRQTKAEWVTLEIDVPPANTPVWRDDQITRDWLEGIEESRARADRELLVEYVP